MLVTLIIGFLGFLLAGSAGSLPDNKPDVEDGWSGLAGCVLGGQLLAARWLEEHPKWQLNRIRCTPGNPPRTDDV